MLENANLGVEAQEALQNFGYAFGQKMNELQQNVDMTMPEARKFREAWEELRDEFQAFMDLTQLSSPAELAALVEQAESFAQKIDSLPPVRKRQVHKSEMQLEKTGSSWFVPISFRKWHLLCMS